MKSLSYYQKKPPLRSKQTVEKVISSKRTLFLPQIDIACIDERHVFKLIEKIKNQIILCIPGLGVLNKNSLEDSAYLQKVIDKLRSVYGINLTVQPHRHKDCGAEGLAQKEWKSSAPNGDISIIEKRIQEVAASCGCKGVDDIESSEAHFTQSAIFTFGKRLLFDSEKKRSSILLSMICFMKKKISKKIIFLSVLNFLSLLLVVITQTKKFLLKIHLYTISRNQKC
jgi:hypothetical protein